MLLALEMASENSHKVTSPPWNIWHPVTNWCSGIKHLLPVWNSLGGYSNIRSPTESAVSLVIVSQPNLSLSPFLLPPFLCPGIDPRTFLNKLPNYILHLRTRFQGTKPTVVLIEPCDRVGVPGNEAPFVFAGLSRLRGLRRWKICRTP